MFGGFETTEMYNSVDRINEYYRSFGNHRIATHLRKKGWDIECLDYSWAFSYDELKEYVDARITKETVFVGVSVIFMLTVDQARNMNRLLEYIRKKYPWVKSVAGGVKSWCITTIHADYYIAGHGEYAIEALLKNLMGRGEPVKFSTVEKTGLKIIDTIHDYPCWPKRDASISYEERDHIQSYETLNIELGRGCRFACKYCTFPLLGIKGDMSRDEDSVYEELKENYDRWGVKSYYITDDTVNDRPEKMKMVGNAVRRLPFQPMLNGYARVDLMISHGKEVWDDMIDAGFTSHSYGVESFDHRSAKTMGKGMHPDKIKDGLLQIEDYFTKRSPYFYTGSLTMICGLPYESLETMDKGVDWLNKYWRNHTVGYLPLYLQHNDNDKIDELDGNITSDFIKLGYTFHEVDDIEYLLSMVNPLIKDGLKRILKERSESNPHKTAKFNYWIHPSGDYDWLDAIEWVMEFAHYRQYNLKDGRPGTYCFDGFDPWATESLYGSLDNLKDYYREGRKIPNEQIKFDMIQEYKKKKLGLR